MKAERGFTLLEVAIAIALSLAAGLITLGIVRGLTALASARSTAAGGALTLEQQADDLRADAATAFAVFVPTRDVMRRTNDGPGGPHEVDFYTQNDRGARTFWAYAYDAATHTLQRFDYDETGHVGVANRTTGAIDTRGSYPALPGVTAFRATTLAANELVRAGNPYGAAIAPAFTGATPRPLPVGFEAGGAPRADLYGGNATVELRIATEHGSQTLHLASAALPSGFIVHAAPQFHAIVYRVDQTHRFLFGLAGKSHVFVNARLDVSYDGWKSEQTWCDFNLYGYPGGLTGGAAEDYHPEWFTESTAGIVYAVTHAQTPGATCPVAPPAQSTR